MIGKIGKGVHKLLKGGNAGRDRRVLVIGLDCVTPQLFFDHWLDQLPTIKRLVESSIHGPLKSCIPPITVPAWACMTTGKNPGQLGIYGFRNRFDNSYDGLTIATSQEIKEFKKIIESTGSLDYSRSKEAALVKKGKEALAGVPVFLDTLRCT